MARRKTAAERRQAEADAKQLVWREFSTKLRKASTFEEVRQLAFGPAPAQGEPGRQFYSNLAFYMRTSFVTVPDGSGRAERTLYAEMIQRLRDAGELPEQKHSAKEDDGPTT